MTHSSSKPGSSWLVPAIRVLVAPRKQDVDARTTPGVTSFALLRQVLLQSRPAQLRLLQEARRSGGECIAVVLAAEQIKPLPRDQPKPGVAGKGDAARQIDRVVASKLGAVNIGMGDKRRTIALVAEAPDRAGVGGLELRQTDQGTGVDEVSDRVETLDRDTRVAVHDHPFRRRGAGRELREGLRAEACQQKEKGYYGAKFHSGATAVSFLPLCRHSWYR